VHFRAASAAGTTSVGVPRILDKPLAKIGTGLGPATSPSDQRNAAPAATWDTGGVLAEPAVTSRRHDVCRKHAFAISADRVPVAVGSPRPCHPSHAGGLRSQAESDVGLSIFLSVDPDPGSSANDYDYCNADPINCSDLGGDKPQEKRLSKEEQEAIYNKDHGKPYDEDVYKEAMNKVRYNEKIAGDRNRQKRQSNYFSPPDSETVLHDINEGVSYAPYAVAGAAIGAGAVGVGAALLELLDFLAAL